MSSSSRWAQFFICPLMIEDAIEREVEAVDSGESLSLSVLCLSLSVPTGFLSVSYWLPVCSCDL